MINSSLIISYGTTFFTTYLLLYYVFHKYLRFTSHLERVEIDRWIHEHDLTNHRKLFERDGIDSLSQLATIDVIPQLPIMEEERIRRASTLLKEKLIFAQWLKSLNLYQYFFRLLKDDVNSLEDIYYLNEGMVHQILGKDYAIWVRGRTMLPSSKDGLEILKSDLWNTFLDAERSADTVNAVWFTGFLLVLSASLAGVCTLIYKYWVWFAVRNDRSILRVITGRYLDPSVCTINFEWQDPCPVGETLTFTVEFFQRNSLPFPVCDKDDVQIEIIHGVRKISCAVTLGGTDPKDANLAIVKFSVRQAGEYQINVVIRNVHIAGSPFVKRFLPGPVDATKTRFEKQSSIVICCLDIANTLMIQPRDSFQNLCLGKNTIENMNYIDLNLYQSIVMQEGEEKQDVCFQSFNWDKTSSKVSFELMFLHEGCYQVQVYYDNVLIQNGDFTCVVLNRSDYNQTMKCVKSRCISYEGKLTRIEGEAPFKPKKVIMYISPKQFTVKECVLKFLMKRVVTFRLCPSTKLHILDETANGVATFSVDDGYQPTIYLAAINRNVIAATFTKFLLNNIGGSETFVEKQYFFYYEVRRHHQKHKHEPLTLKIDRKNILLSSLKATKNFTLKEWCSNFEVIFLGELGVDWGGLRREWFRLTCEALFNPTSNLFKGLSNNPQALVHPNKNRPSYLKLKYYDFAGKFLGKCLYESALGGTYSQFITAKFTRSFLAQLIGLRINHIYFQSDDPDLYIRKVKYILENDVSSMDLYFIDEEYDSDGQLAKVIDLLPNGHKIKVTNSSKRQYLDNLAQYRLASCVKDEIEAFQRGLNEIIPDNLLSIFDENELELLLCGTGEYSITDFRAHHIVHGTYPPSSDFDRVLRWFWIAVSNFTTEEMARLLQFTTGSSQLPLGGFKDLSPQFQIMHSPSYGTLPTAHTCFNQLCLPDYDSYEQFEKSLLLAITEGNEGFGLV